VEEIGEILAFFSDFTFSAVEQILRLFFMAKCAEMNEG